MDRTIYQANSAATSSYNGDSSTFLYQPEPKKPFYHSRRFGLSVLILVVVSVLFLSFAIFYDEIFSDNDNDDHEEYTKFNANATGSEIKYIFNNRKELSTTTENTLENSNLSIISEQKINITKNSKQTITFENFINGDFSPKVFRGKWISDNELIHYDPQNNLCITNVSDMRKTILVQNESIKRFRLSGLSLSSDRKYLLVLYGLRRVFRYSTIAEYRIFSISNGELYPAIFAPENPHETFLQYAEWGPIGSQLVFVYQNNLYFKSDAKSEPIKLTNSGKDLTIYNGIPDWVYEEEIICGPKTFWLSPDGRKLVYATINDSNVDLMSWPYYGPYYERNGIYNQYTRIVSIRYPKPGRRIPAVSMNFISLKNLKKTYVGLGHHIDIDNQIIVLKPPKDIVKLGDYLLTTFKWIDNENFAINWMTRAQNYSVMTVYSENNNWKQTSNFELQSKNGWIDLFTPPLITPDMKSYFVRTPKINTGSDDHFTHIAKVSVKKSKAVYLTTGQFEVKELLKINPESGRLYFSATFPIKPGEKHLMSVSLNVTEMNSDPVCHTCLMNEKSIDENICLTSDYDFSKNAEHYILHCNGPNIPRTELYKTINDSLIRILENNIHLKHNLQDISLPSRILIKVPVEGNNAIDVMLIVPEDFDENSSKKYPIIFHVYGGPGSDSGSVTQTYLYNQFSAYIVSNKSLIYALIDTRGSPNHGCKFMYDIYRKIGSVEVEDTINVARYFRDKISYVDKDLISIWGWSYGGYLTTMALIGDHNDPVFKCGVAVAPVSDWMLYDSVYVERFMGFPTPDDNLENYIKSSTLDKVKYLNGKQFLIMFGTADDNVHSQNSMMLMKALNEANIKYETQIYPDNNHNLQHSIAHMYMKMTDFLDKCFAKK